MKKIKIMAIGLISIAFLVLTGCSKSEVSDSDIAEHLKPMTLASETKTPIQKTEFCTTYLKYYGEYGKIVSDRAKIQSEAGSGNYSEDDIYNNITGQQDVVQKMENYTAQYSVTDSSDVEQNRQTFRTPSQNLIKAYKKAKDDKTLSNLDGSIVKWGEVAQPLAMVCAS